MKNIWCKLAVLSAMIAVLIVTTMALAEDPPTSKPAESKKPTYVGSKGCKACHMGEKNGKVWEIWSESKHAKSIASLDSTKGETKNPKCLKCHTTGYGAGGYGAEGMEGKDLTNVGCEVCHGPGSEYKGMQVMKDRKASIAAGLVIPDEKTCLKCHNEESPTFNKEKPFKYGEMVAKIAHKLPAKTAPAGETKP